MCIARETGAQEPGKQMEYYRELTIFEANSHISIKGSLYIILPVCCNVSPDKSKTEKNKKNIKIVWQNFNADLFLKYMYEILTSNICSRLLF